MTDQDRCTDTNPHPAHRTQYGGFGVKDCPGVPMTSINASISLADLALTAEDRAALSPAWSRPVPTFADRTAALEELRAERVTTGRLEGDLRSQTRAVREALAERDEARRERDKLVEVIGRLISLPPEAIADAYEVGYGTPPTGCNPAEG